MDGGTEVCLPLSPASNVKTPYKSHIPGKVIILYMRISLNIFGKQKEFKIVIINDTLGLKIKDT